jgi:hypothetical protein
LRSAGFQDRSHQPLDHPSEIYRVGAIDLNRHDGSVNRRYLYAAKQVCHRQAAEQASGEFVACMKIRSTGLYVRVNIIHAAAEFEKPPRKQI